MARRIETPVATLLGTVDRVRRRIDWAVECPKCEAAIPLSREQFEGEQPVTCECGWKSPRDGTDPPSWYPWALQLRTVPPREQREPATASRVAGS
jgi:hypothetical protein